MRGQTGSYKGFVLIHSFLLLGQAMFFIIATVLVTTNVFIPQLKKIDPYLQITELVVAGICAFFSARRFASALAKIQESDMTPNQRITAYVKANIARWLTLEAPTIMGIVFFLLTGNYAFIVLAGSLILYVAIALRPIALKAAIQLRMSEEEVRNYKGESSADGSQ